MMKFSYRSFVVETHDSFRWFSKASILRPKEGSQVFRNIRPHRKQ